MSTPPRDAGIPMLTEVIEEEAMDFVGPPSPEAVAAVSAAGATPDLAAPEPQPAPPLALQPAASGYAPHGLGMQYGPTAQFAPSYPIPLKPAASASAPVPQAVTDMPPVGSAGLPAAPGAPLPAPMSEDEWQRMERRVRERILGQLLSRTDAMLEERIRSSVAGVLEQAVDNLAATLRASLHKTLEDVVSRAVAQEISRLQSPKK
jgi:hypothetical protein